MRAGRGLLRLRRAARRGLLLLLAVAVPVAATVAAREDPAEGPRPPASAAAAGGAAGTEGEAGPLPDPRGPSSPRPSPPRTARAVEAPVRIADAAAVRLLRPGGRVDVLAPVVGGGRAEASSEGRARLVARCARVAAVPEPTAGPQEGPETVSGAVGGGAPGNGGALVVLSVPRPTAARLVAAAEHARLAVALC